MGKAFETFVIAKMRYIAIPWNNGVYILDEDGRGYGAYFTVANFRKAKSIESVGAVRLSVQCK